MKKTIVILSLFACLSCKNETQSEQTATKTEFPQQALAQNMTALDGTTITLEQILETYQGKPILIDVWASWCPDCIAGIPKLEKLQQEFPEVTYLFLSYDRDDESWKNGIEKYNVTGEHYLIQSEWKGGDFRKHIDLDWIPRYMVIDKDGKIALYRAIEADDQNLISTLKEL
ncbi:MAG: TlpA disulfide reductase family protein [Flavobacteriaceae bacterium]